MELIGRVKQMKSPQEDYFFSITINELSDSALWKMGSYIFHTHLLQLIECSTHPGKHGLPGELQNG